MTGALFDLKRYITTVYPVRGVCLDADASAELQDTHVSIDTIQPGALAETSPPPEAVACNVLEKLDISSRGYTRSKSLFSLFLDGTRRTYLVAEMATTGKRYLPVLAGQVSAAVLQRNRSTGQVGTYMHRARRLMLVPSGGSGMNDDDIGRLRKDVAARGRQIEVETYRCKEEQEPQDAAIAMVNRLMQLLEIEALESLVNHRMLRQDEMLVVDGSVQFQNVKEENLFWLKHVIGVAKSFNTHLSFMRDKTEVGALLARVLLRPGDRTAAFRWKMDERHQYAIWYLRLRDPRHVDSPLAGVIKVEKLLATDEEREAGLPSDTVNNISASLLGERYVTPYGKDARWANHLYPVFLAECVQKTQFLGDAHFLRLF